ncbi:phytanoyl-CoA dioxygenase family protein [Rhodococcus wratislaviensis]|nr:phytanoyl-CoA dioxygenase family protein [Rhodococcus sp. 3A]MBC2893279.1 phytanoyl-CoA dioxygenase family protein [Rhodococcus sp. 4CII]
MTSIKGSILRSVPNSTPVNDIMTIVHEDGGVIIEDFLTEGQVRALNSDIDVAIGAIDPGAKYDDSFMIDFHGRNTKRLTRMFETSETFRTEVLDLDLFHALGDAVFLEESGTFWMTTAQVIEIGPGNSAQPLHRDLENWPLFVTLGPSGPEAGINFLTALTDFTEENGATRIIPGSHTWPDFEDRGTPEMTVPVEMKAGSAALYLGKTVHGGGENRTKNQYRRAMSIALQASYLTPEEPWPFLVDVEDVRPLPERVQSILGFRSQYPKGSPGLYNVDFADLADHLKLTSSGG